MILRYAAVPALLVALATGASAQTWMEIGDAGDLPATSQVTAGTGALTTLHGTLLDDFDRDVYCIRVISPATASVRLSCTTFADDDLWLFDVAGNGLAGNDGCSGGFVALSSPLIFAPGVHYLAIASSSDEPTRAGQPIWDPPAAAGQRIPDGPGAPGPIDGWSGTGVLSAPGSYTLQLQGCGFCDAPVPATPGTWGSLKQLYR